MSIFRYPK